MDAFREWVYLMKFAIIGGGAVTLFLLSVELLAKLLHNFAFWLNS